MIAIRNLTKTYDTPAGAFLALRGIDLEVRDGEFVAIVGKSGSGKSTLLNMIGGIDQPTEGAVTIGGVAIDRMNRDQLAQWRGRTVGFVFQFFQLLPTLTVAENVMLPMDFTNSVRSRDRLPRALALLERIGVREQADKLPAALSGGQQQRVAIARALANDPPLIVADEPTGNLDSATASEVLRVFGELSAEGKTVVIVTHERDAVGQALRTGRSACPTTIAHRTITIADGSIA